MYAYGSHSCFYWFYFLLLGCFRFFFRLLEYELNGLELPYIHSAVMCMARRRWLVANTQQTFLCHAILKMSMPYFTDFMYLQLHIAYNLYLYFIYVQVHIYNHDSWCSIIHFFLWFLFCGNFLSRIYKMLILIGILFTFFLFLFAQLILVRPIMKLNLKLVVTFMIIFLVVGSKHVQTESQATFGIGVHFYILETIVCIHKIYYIVCIKISIPYNI